jgi:ABC-type nitrate/sulfonate/bicarbonate transport system permease component
MMPSAETWKGLALPVTLIVAGEIFGRMANLTDIDSLAPPSAIVMAFLEAVRDGSVLTTTRDTLVTAFTGLVIGASVGLMIGILLGVLPVADRLMEVTIESIRPIPSIAILPIVLIALGFGYRLEIAIISFACMWPLLILTRAAVRGVEPRLMEVSRALRLSPAARVIKIVIPAALPRIFVAFRLAAGIALIVSVTVEIAINPLGLGHALMVAQQALRPDLMLAYLVWLGVVGWSLNALLLLAQNRLFGRAAIVEDVQ